jgi:hypothetical protein
MSVERTKLWEIFNQSKIEEKNYVELDRDPHIFSYLLQFLRLGEEAFPQIEDEVEAELFDDELLYWGIKQELMIRKLDEIFSGRPVLLEGFPLQKWYDFN